MYLLVSPSALLLVLLPRVSDSDSETRHERDSETETTRQGLITLYPGNHLQSLDIPRYPSKSKHLRVKKIACNIPLLPLFLRKSERRLAIAILGI